MGKITGLLSFLILVLSIGSCGGNRYPRKVFFEWENMSKMTSIYYIEYLYGQHKFIMSHKDYGGGYYVTNDRYYGTSLHRNIYYDYYLKLFSYLTYRKNGSARLTIFPCIVVAQRKDNYVFERVTITYREAYMNGYPDAYRLCLPAETDFQALVDDLVRVFGVSTRDVEYIYASVNVDSDGWRERIKIN